MQRGAATMSLVKVRTDAVAMKGATLPGYVQDVLAAAHHSDATHIYLTQDAYVRLVAKYSDKPIGIVASASIPAGGPGTELKKMLRRWLGIVATPTCPCNAHAAQMDLWGPDECERRLDEIVGWLGEEAARRKLPFVRAIAAQVVRLAIRRARKAAADSGTGDINP